MDISIESGDLGEASYPSVYFFNIPFTTTLVLLRVLLL